MTILRIIQVLCFVRGERGSPPFILSITTLSMSNKIVEKYFDHKDRTDRYLSILEEIKIKTGFQEGEEIFRGKIYDNDKIGSLIYKGIWQGMPAVLKIQGLELEVDEIDIISKFNLQNKSTKVRLATLSSGEKWNPEKGYGYLLLEYVEAPQIYTPPFAEREHIKEFCAFYREYKTLALCTPFFKKEVMEESSLLFTTQRIAHWTKIAQEKGFISDLEIGLVEKYISLAGKHLPSIKMEFMHGHLTYNDIFALPDHTYVLMSNLFWSYRPEYYDTTFHLWAAIKGIRDITVRFIAIKEYIQNWIDEYKKIPVIQDDEDFERKFFIMLAERCIGALLLDIRLQEYVEESEKYESHLKILFQELFLYCTEQLESE